MGEFTLPSGVDLTIFIPCLNEEQNVGGALDVVFAASGKAGLTCEALVYDDASTDGTREVVRAYQAAHPELRVALICNEKRRGLAHNFVEGAFRGTGKYYRMVVGDNVEPMETHLAIMRAIGSAEIIIPVYTEIRNRKLNRKIISKLFTWLVNMISGNRIGYYNGGAVILRYDVQRYHVETTGFGMQAQFLTRLVALGRSYRELPLVAYDRPGSTALTLQNLLSVGHSLVTIGLRRLRTMIYKP